MIQPAFVPSTRAAAADVLPSVSLLEFCKAHGCEPSKVILTKENRYKALILKEISTGYIQCIMFGKRSAESVNEGDAPRPQWSIVQLDNGMLRISTNTQQYEGFESLYA